MNRVQLLTIVLLVFSPVLHVHSQTIKDEDYGVMVVRSPSAYAAQVRSDTALRMLDISKIVPTIKLDLRYASANNFMHRKLYPPMRTTWLRAPAAWALHDIQNELAKEGLGLKIFDAYRPYSVTKKMWTLIHDERYVADPSKGSGHNRGIAVDLTIINLENRKELDMGTGFDNFTDSAHRDFTALPETVLANRKKFEAIMVAHGFVPLPTEWWHYYWKDAAKFDVLDLPQSFR